MAIFFSKELLSRLYLVQKNCYLPVISSNTYLHKNYHSKIKCNLESHAPIFLLNSSNNIHVNNGLILASEVLEKKINNNKEHPLKASEDQLVKLKNHLIETLPNFFKYPHDFRIYNKNIVFEDNIRNVKTVGINSYAWQITRIRLGAHLKYGKILFKILKITEHADDSTVKIRWRIITYPGNKIIFAFWNFNMFNYRESLNKTNDEWIDGFSIFHVGIDGLVYKLVCDQVIPDSNTMKTKKDSPLASKLGMA